MALFEVHREDVGEDERDPSENAEWWSADSGVSGDVHDSDIRALIAEIEAGSIVIRIVGPKILEVSRPNVESMIRVAEPIYDSADFMGRKEGIRGWIM